MLRNGSIFVWPWVIYFVTFVLRVSAKRYVEAEKATKKEVERSLGRWFTGGSDRDGAVAGIRVSRRRLPQVDDELE